MADLRKVNTFFVYIYNGTGVHTLQRKVHLLLHVIQFAGLSARVGHTDRCGKLLGIVENYSTFQSEGGVIFATYSYVRLSLNSRIRLF